jgi:hypothetical protein
MSAMTPGRMMAGAWSDVAADGDTLDDQGGWAEPLVLRVSPVDPNKPRRADLVLVHGFGGDRIATWRFESKTHSCFWPGWLQEELHNVRVLTAGYPTPWLPEAPRFENLALAVHTALENADVGAVPVVFVCHSLGGLLIKRVLEIDADERASTEGKSGAIWMNTRGVAFFSTPHGGSALGNLGQHFGNRLLEYLANDCGEGIVDELQRRFSAKLKAHGDPQIRTYNFYETKKIHRMWVVEPESARAGFPAVESAPVFADHIWMVKFNNRQNNTYIRLRRLIEEWIEGDKTEIVADDRSLDCVRERPRILPRIPRVIWWNSLLVAAGALGLAIVLIAIGIWRPWS